MTLKRTNKRPLPPRGLRFEQLENRSLLATAPVGPEIALITNPILSQQTGLESFGIRSDGTQFAFANTSAGTPIFGAAKPDNVPIAIDIKPNWPPSYHSGSVSPSGRMLRIENESGSLFAQECTLTTALDPVTCGQGLLVNPSDTSGTWNPPFWYDYDVANRDDDGESPGTGIEGLVVWSESWRGSQTSSLYEHRIRARFVSNTGVPQPGQPFVVPGSEAGFGSTYESPQVAMSTETGAAVITWQENGFPRFSLRQPDGTWTKTRASAVGPVIGMDSTSFPAVSMADDGSFVMAWVEHRTISVPGQGLVVTKSLGIQQFDVQGNPTNKNVIESTATPQDWTDVDVDMRADGSFVVVAVDNQASQDIVYFDFDSAGNLRPYYTGVNPITASSSLPNGTTWVIDPALLPRVNSDLTGIKESVKVETNVDSFIVAWSTHNDTVALPWQIQSRFYSEGTTDILGRIDGSRQLWLGSVNLGGVGNAPPLEQQPFQAFPAGDTWGPMLVGDFDGDGNDEVMSRSAQTGEWWLNDGVTVERRGVWASRVTWVDVTVGDFDGDGDDDIAGRASQSGAWWVSLSNGSSDMTNKVFGRWSSRIVWTNVLPGDFNGDGKTDIAGRTPGNGAWWVAISTGTDLINARWGVWSTRQDWQEIQVGDFNNDGRDDLVGRVAASGAWYVAESQLTSFTTNYWGRWTTAVDWTNIVVGDFDGDGADDLAGKTPGSNSWWVAESRNDYFLSNWWTQWTPGESYVDIVVGDFSGDGRDDIIGRKQDTGEWLLSLSTGLSFSSLVWGDWTPPTNATEVQAINHA